MSVPNGGPDPGWPVVAWRTLGRGRYRAALRGGRLASGVWFEAPPRADRPTVVFIHGAGGAPVQFRRVARVLDDRANLAALLWDDSGRLAPTAALLREALLRLGESVAVVAHSMGALLPAYLGATDAPGLLRGLAAVYLNPLVGGSRWAGDFRPLRRLGLGPVLQRVLFPPHVLDLAPESEFQQAICGTAGSASSFAEHTAILFTERPGREPDIPPARVPLYFGRTREQVLERWGTVLAGPPGRTTGHDAPLDHPQLVLPILEPLLTQFTSRAIRSQRTQRSGPSHDQ